MKFILYSTTAHYSRWRVLLIADRTHAFFADYMNWQDAWDSIHLALTAHFFLGYPLDPQSAAPTYTLPLQWIES